MSDRTAVPPDQQMVQKFREFEDRLRTLETRGVPGNVALTTASVADLSVEASATTPVRLNGSAAWTQAVEYLGVQPQSPGGYSPNGNHALVTRDELGRAQGIVPVPTMQVNSGPGAGLVLATNTLGTVTAIGGTTLGGPFAESAMYLGNGIFSIPIAGWWRFTAIGVWVGVADSTLRQLLLDVSTNGGASWGTLATDYRIQASTGENVYHALTRSTQMAAGWQFRVQVRTRSAGGGTYFNESMTLQFERGLV